MFIKNTLKIRERSTGKLYECFTQAVDLNFDGKYVLRYNIGINGYHEWHHVCNIYNNDQFNERFEVIGG